MTDTPSPNGTPPVPATGGATTAPKKPAAPRAVRAKPVKAAATKRGPSPKMRTAAKPAATKAASVKAAATKATAKVREEAATLSGQAADKARSYAAQGKDKATDALDGLSKAMNEAASQVDGRLGSQYGDYARSAASAVASFASSIKAKDVDDIVADARDVVRKSPVVAIGAAAAIGFVFVRLLKSGTANAAPTPKRKPRKKSS